MSNVFAPITVINLVNLGLKELYCVIPSLPVSQQFKNEIASMQNPFVMSRGKELLIQKRQTLIDHLVIGTYLL